MNCKKNYCILFAILSFISCSSQKTLEVTPNVVVPNERVYAPPSPSKDINKGSFNLSCYEFINTDSITLQPIKILNIDSLKASLTYPDIAIRAGIDGIVLIEVGLDDNSEIININPISNIGAGLEEAVVSGIKGFQFKFEKSSNKNNKSILLIVNFYLHRASFFTPVY
jgi:hypothetical protein